MSLLTSYLSTKIIVLIQIDTMNMQIVYLEKQLDSLKAALELRKDELNRLEELRKIISAEENEIDRLTQFSKQLKEKVGRRIIFHSHDLIILVQHIKCLFCPFFPCLSFFPLCLSKGFGASE